MEVEHTISKTADYAYTFSSWEQKLIARCIQPEIKKIEKKIAKIESNPYNEGQVKYLVQIEELESEIKTIKDIVNQFSK